MRPCITGTGRKRQPQATAREAANDAMERDSWGRGSEHGLAGRWPVLGTSPQFSVSPRFGCLGEASFVVVTTLRWQAATLSGESKQYTFTEPSRPGLDCGWVRVDSLENFLWAPIARHCFELTGFGSRHEIYSSKISRRVL